jgi:hypothetical protein
MMPAPAPAATMANSATIDPSAARLDDFDPPLMGARDFWADSTCTSACEVVEVADEPAAPLVDGEGCAGVAAGEAFTSGAGIEPDGPTFGSGRADPPRVTLVGLDDGSVTGGAPWAATVGGGMVTGVDPESGGDPDAGAPPAWP